MEDVIRRQREELGHQLLRLRDELVQYLAHLDYCSTAQVLPSDVVGREQVAIKSLAAHLDETLLNLGVGVHGGTSAAPVVPAAGSVAASVRMQREADESEIRDVEDETKT